MVGKEIAVIVPDKSSLNVYDTYLSNYRDKNFTFKYYSSIDDFSSDLLAGSKFFGFIVDLRIMLNAGSNDKEFLHYLIESFPFIRISHSMDSRRIKGSIDGKTMENDELMDYFSCNLERKVENERGKEMNRDLDGSQTFGVSVGDPKNIVLIVNNDESRAVYKSQLKRYENISVQYFQSGKELMESISKKNRFCGFMIDLKTMIKSEQKDKDFLYELIDSFPAARVLHTSDKKTIKGNVNNRNFRDEELFDFFINDLCANFDPRGIRASKRKPLFLNIFLCSDFFDGDSTDISGELVKANTMNVSEEGIFIVTHNPPKTGRPFHIVIQELSDQEPIECIVKWIQPWGESAQHLPGIGAAFRTIKPQQLDELRMLLSGKKTNN